MSRTGTHSIAIVSLSFLLLNDGASAAPRGPGRGFPAVTPWVSYYGSAAKMGPLADVASAFRIINIDADPHIANFSPSEIANLRAKGRNRVLSYLNVGACESFRDYFHQAPDDFVPCGKNRKAQRGAYAGYPDEVWMDPSDSDHQKLIVEHVAARLAATGVDGFFLDNLEIVEHGDKTDNGPCNARCVKGGLALVARLRAAFPDHLIVMQNAVGAVTRSARISGGRFAPLLDGISVEGALHPQVDRAVVAHLRAWKALRLRPGRRAFFIGTEDYTGSCNPTPEVRAIYQRSRTYGFSPYVSDASAGQQVVCRFKF